ncbi:RHS repeat-associated core domain-containing protein [Myxococcota bacterium]|nr:RHS repeat-associated core domain-containing protein [Myxococcota bacterium]
MERVATSPDTSTLSHSYDAGGRLLAIEGSLVHDPGTRDFVTSIAYNARGQRTEVVYGNDTRTRSTYDPHRFWPTRILTERTSDSPATKLQDLALSYDVVGNVIGITDAAQQTEFFANVQVDADQAFAYDALYRLVSATGREKAALAQPGAADPTPGGVPDGGAANTVMARYTEEFQYDQAGNLTEMKHIRGGSTVWRRGYAVAADSNRLVKSSVPGDDPDDPGTYSDLYTTSARGAIVRMPHLRSGMDNLVPDHRDQVRKAELNSSGDVAWYAYGADKKRVMKRVIRGQNVEDRIYVGGWEVWRKRVSGALQEARETLHVLDGDKRVCLVESVTVHPTLSTPMVLFRFQLGNQVDSASLEVDEAGAVLSYEEYHPYGSTAWWAEKSGVEVSRKRYRYTGMERDEETGLQVHHHRYYAPWLGRWTSADPAGLVDGGNRWGYARGRPTGGRDPSGLETSSGSDSKKESDSSDGASPAMSVTDSRAGPDATPAEVRAVAEQAGWGYPADVVPEWNPETGKWNVGEKVWKLPDDDTWARREGAPPSGGAWNANKHRLYGTPFGIGMVGAFDKAIQGPTGVSQEVETQLGIGGPVSLLFRAGGRALALARRLSPVHQLRSGIERATAEGLYEGAEEAVSNLAPRFRIAPTVGEYLSAKAPMQVTPGVRTLTGRHVNDIGRVEPWRAHFDEYGRLIGRTDYNAGNKAAGIPDIHYHTYEWGRGKTPLETGSHLPGEYVP